MPYCSECGVETAAAAKFCPECGTGTEALPPPVVHGRPLDLRHLGSTDYAPAHRTRPVFKVLGWLIIALVGWLLLVAVSDGDEDGLGVEEVDLPVEALGVSAASPSVVEAVVAVTNPTDRLLTEVDCIAFALVGNTDVTGGFLESLLTVEGGLQPREVARVGLSLSTVRGEAPYVDSIRITCSGE